MLSLIEYKLQLKLDFQNREILVDIFQKSHNLWARVGDFQIRAEKCLVLDKQEYYKDISCLTNAETFFSLHTEKIYLFWEIINDLHLEDSCEELDIFINEIVA